MSTRPVYLVTESDGFFGSLRQPWEGMDLDELERYLGAEFKPTRITWMQLANGSIIPKNAIILHSSSQQAEYKSFIDDILLYLEALGNLLVPSIHATRSHENKGYQELHKRLLGIPSLNATYLAKLKELDIRQVRFPAVLKHLSGFGSGGVSLLRSTEDLISAGTPKLRLPWRDLVKYWKHHLAYAVRKHVLQRSNLRPYGDYYAPLQRLVIQQFIPNLLCDYKVLTFQNRIFIARRGVRPNDFRASGSGLIQWDALPAGLMVFAEETLKKFAEPFMSFDIAYDGEKFHLIEFQGIHFGPYVLYEAPTHFHRRDGTWQETTEKASLETAVGESLRTFLSEI